MCGRLFLPPEPHVAPGFCPQRSVLESLTELCDPMDRDIEVFTVNSSVSFMFMFESREDFWSEAAVSALTRGETRCDVFSVFMV